MVYVEKHTICKRDTCTYHKENNMCITKATNRNQRRYLLVFHKDQSHLQLYNYYDSLQIVYVSWHAYVSR